MRISLNPDKNEVTRIRQQIKDNDGYCPCATDRTPETKCMCTAFVSQPYNGWCHCGLYYKSEV